MHCVEVRGSSVYVGFMWQGQHSRTSVRRQTKLAAGSGGGGRWRWVVSRWMRGVFGQVRVVKEALWPEVSRNVVPCVRLFFKFFKAALNTCCQTFFSCQLEYWGFKGKTWEIFWFLNSDTVSLTVRPVWQKRSRFSTCSKNLILDKKVCLLEQRLRFSARFWLFHAHEIQHSEWKTFSYFLSAS